MGIRTDDWIINTRDFLRVAAIVAIGTAALCGVWAVAEMVL